MKSDIKKLEMLCPLRYLSVNDDKMTFTAVFPTQYHMFSYSPFTVHLSRIFDDISLSMATTCCGTRYIAVNGLPADPRFNSKHVKIFDHSKEKDPQIFYHQFEQYVLSMKITPQLLFCAFHDHVEVWDIAEHQKIHHLPNGINVHAPCDVSSDYKFLASAGPTPTELSITSLVDHTQRHISVADNPLSLVRFSKTESLLATTSSSGHAIKIWDPASGEVVAKFKRGIRANVIHSVDFSPDNEFVVVFTQNGTLHFFDNRNRKSGGSVATVRSVHRISLGESQASIVSWVARNKVAILSMDGTMIVLTLDDQCHEIGREQILFMRRILEFVSTETPQ